MFWRNSAGIFAPSGAKIKKAADNISSLTRKNKAYGAESTSDVSTADYSIADLYELVKTHAKAMLRRGCF